MASPNPSIADTLKDLWALLKAYAQQETIDPLKSTGRFLGYGIAGGLMLSLGGFFLALSLLRALQTQTGDVFADTWSFVPYLIVFVALVVVVAIVLSRVNKTTYLSDTGVPTSHDPDPAHPRPLDVQASATPPGAGQGPTVPSPTERDQP